VKKLSVLLESNQNIDLETMILYLIITLVLTAIIFLVYKITYSGVAYSKNFNVSIVLTGMITTIVMMVIGNNLALSLGMVGALSIVRFRAAIKEPKDISFLFWAIAIGLSVGSGAIQIAIVGTIFIALTIFFYQIGLGKQQNAYLLIVKGGLFEQEKVETLVKKQSKSYRLRMKNTKKETMEAIYEVRLKPNMEAMLIQELYKLELIQQVNIVTFDGHLNE
jgi:uncharacterized membrane protein YhiD involved in acid resistance